MKKHLWFLTEERPKKEVLATIFQKFAKDFGFAFFLNPLRILPILENGKFTFKYEVIGFSCAKVEKVFIKTISGQSSLVDYLIFYQDEEPTQNDIPIYAIEETKTDDSESRNTGVYQRCTKFVFVEYYYPNIKKIMLYNLKIEQKKEPTPTYIFGTRLLLNFGVEILGKVLDKKIFTPFKSIDEVIKFKGKINARGSNVSIQLKKSKDKIQISGRLFKSGGLAHDPNIGALSLISAVLRKFGWKKQIEITKHGLQQNHVGKRNKYIQIANKLNTSLEYLQMPRAELNQSYWHYETKGEKLGTIFIHLVVENFTSGFSIYENHAGCERGYFYTKDGKPIALEKYEDRQKYKAGDKDKKLHLPDLILIDFDRSEIINVEGKKYEFRRHGIEQLKKYDYIEKNYIKKHYPKFKFTRTVVLYGSQEEKIIEIEVGFLLNKNGGLILGIKAPKLFKEAVKNLLDYWSL